MQKTAVAKNAGSNEECNQIVLARQDRNVWMLAIRRGPDDDGSGCYIRRPTALNMSSSRNCSVPLLGLFLLAGCYPHSAEYVDEYNLVYTNYSTKFDFKAHQTYALPDSVMKITGSVWNGGQIQYVDQLAGDAILNRIRQNMDSRGWTEDVEANSPDVILLPSAITTTTIDYYYGGYWGWYYPGYSPGGGWYYPGYYPATLTSYTSGTLMIQMTDPNEISSTHDRPVEWLALVNGLLEGSSSTLLNSINTTVDQAFTQSPYLTH